MSTSAIAQVGPDPRGERCWCGEPLSEHWRGRACVNPEDLSQPYRNRLAPTITTDRPIGGELLAGMQVGS